MLKLELLKLPKGLLNMLDFISIFGDTEMMGCAINLSKEPAYVDYFCKLCRLLVKFVTLILSESTAYLLLNTSGGL